MTERNRERTRAPVARKRIIAHRPFASPAAVRSLSRLSTRPILSSHRQPALQSRTCWRSKSIPGRRRPRAYAFSSLSPLTLPADVVAPAPTKGYPRTLPGWRSTGFRRAARSQRFRRSISKRPGIEFGDRSSSAQRPLGSHPDCANSHRQHHRSRSQCFAGPYSDRSCARRADHRASLYAHLSRSTAFRTRAERQRDSASTHRRWARSRALACADEHYSRSATSLGASARNRSHRKAQSACALGYRSTSVG